MYAIASVAMFVVALGFGAHSAISIMATGSFHGDEVPAGTEGTWFALTVENDRAALRSVRATITPERDAVLDDGDEISGRRVDITPALNPEPLILMRGIPGLRTGPVPTALVGQFVEVGARVFARLGQTSYQLTVRCTKDLPVDGQVQQRCDLVVSRDAHDQSLFTYSGYMQDGVTSWAGEQPPAVLWAGDLDGDGRLDLLADTSNHYNVKETRLYLSSIASGDLMLAEAARLTRVGC